MCLWRRRWSRHRWRLYGYLQGVDEGADEVSKGIHYIVNDDRSVSIIPQEDVENYIEVEPRTGFII